MSGVEDRSLGCPGGISIGGFGMGRAMGSSPPEKIEKIPQHGGSRRVVRHLVVMGGVGREASGLYKEAWGYGRGSILEEIRG